MATRIFKAVENAAEMFKLQNQQYSDKLIIADTVPASSEKLSKTGVSNMGHFHCLQLTGHYETLSQVTVCSTPHIEDDGVNHLRGQLIDGAGQRKLFSDYIPLDLFLSPGRIKTGIATIAGGAPTAVSNFLLDDSGYANAAAPADNLFYPFEFEYLFTANSDIILNVKNDSDVDIFYEIVFHGIRLMSNAAVKGAINR
jgi:hypothetical protein